MADRYDFYLAQLVSESEMDDAFAALEQADWDMMADFGLAGIASGMAAVQHNPTPDLTIDVSSGTAYDSNGQRIRIGSDQVVDMSVDYNGLSTAVGSGGNSKVVSLFVYADRTLSDPRIDGNSNTVQYSRAETFAFKVVQGSEATTGTEVAPALEADKILIADVTIDNAQTQILNADINANAVGGNRRQDAFVLTAGALAIRTGTPEASDAAIVTELNNHITGVSNSHDAVAVDYAGGSAWLDGTPNPAVTVEVQLDKIVTDLSSTTGGTGTLGGAGMIGCNARSTWLGGRTNPLTNVHAAINKIINDLAATTASDDGAERVGAEAHTSSSGGTNLTAGSVRSQLNALSNSSVAITGAQTIAGAKTFQDQMTLSTANIVAGESTLVSNIGVLAATTNRYARRIGRIHAGLFHFRDDFVGSDTLSDLVAYTTAAVGGTASIAGGFSTGVLQLQTTTSTNDDVGIITKSEMISSPGAAPILEVILDLGETTNIAVEFGFRSSSTANDKITDGSQSGLAVRFDTDAGDTTWTLVAADGGSITTDASAEAADTNWTRFTLEANADGSATLYKNGDEIASVAASSVGSALCYMYARIETHTTAARTVRIDRFEAWATPISGTV